MKGIMLVAMLLIMTGTLGLVNGRFSHNPDTSNPIIAPIERSVKERHTVNIPAWAGVGAIMAGVVLLLAQKKESFSRSALNERSAANAGGVEPTCGNRSRRGSVRWRWS